MVGDIPSNGMRHGFCINIRQWSRPVFKIFEKYITPPKKDPDKFIVACVSDFLIEYILSWYYNHKRKDKRWIKNEALNMLTGELRSLEGIKCFDFIEEHIENGDELIDKYVPYDKISIEELDQLDFCGMSIIEVLTTVYDTLYKEELDKISNIISVKIINHCDLLVFSIAETIDAYRYQELKDILGANLNK